jgi:hypothetical protein
MPFFGPSKKQQIANVLQNQLDLLYSRATTYKYPTPQEFLLEVSNLMQQKCISGGKPIPSKELFDSFLKFAHSLYCDQGEFVDFVTQVPPVSRYWAECIAELPDLEHQRFSWQIPQYVNYVMNLKPQDLPPEIARFIFFARQRAALNPDTPRLLNELRQNLIIIWGMIIEHLPPPPAGKADFRIELHAFLPNVTDIVATTLKLFVAPTKHHDLLIVLANERNALASNFVKKLSGNDLRVQIKYLGNSNAYMEKLFPPHEHPGSGEQLIRDYFKDTCLVEVFYTSLPAHVPLASCFEHTHIVGGTGHGKTQLLETMIWNDLLAAAEGKGSVVVIDSQGDLIRTISHLQLFDPGQPGSLADKLMLIDPNDIAYPPALNLFGLEMGDITRYDAVEREKLLNSTVALYEYIFGALLGAELTNKQSVIFRYLARLMMVIPNATIHTLIELMEDSKPFREYITKLDGPARRFFETQFFTPTYNDTKRQILHRLWGVLSNPTLDRMFSHPRNKIDLFDAINSGKIVLINTAKDLLKSDGCQLFGRFFISLIAQAAMQRAAIPEDRRRATFVYINEAHEYFDDTIDELLNQARKFKVGLILAHQNLEQLSQSLQATIMASTSIKLAGGVNARDASVFAREMRCEPEFVQSMRKQDKTTHFAYWIKNITPQAITLQVPLGSVNALPALDQNRYAALIAANRARYCTPPLTAIPQEYTPIATAQFAALPDLSDQPIVPTKFKPTVPNNSGFELGSPELI